MGISDDITQAESSGGSIAKAEKSSAPPHYTPPNVLPPEVARRFSSPPHTGPLPYLSVSAPATSGGYGGFRTGDRSDLGAGGPRFAQSGATPGGNSPPDWWNGLVADLDAVSRRSGLGGGLNPAMPNNVSFSNSPGSLATPSQDAIAATPSSPSGQSLFHALLAARRDRRPNDWTMPLPYYSPAPATQPAFDSGLPGMLAQAGTFDPPAGGLLRLLQEHLRNHPDDDAKA